jgi:hypothetical protein
VGVHYPCGYLSQAIDCGSAPNLADALLLEKPLWASEEGSLPFDDGAIAMARAYNRHYIQARITGSINWSLVGSWYANLPYGGVDGLLYANQPWSGHYVVDRAIWATAHTTQFVEPGWQYLDSGSALWSGVGSYVALKAPNNQDWSLILETLDTGLSHTFDVAQTGGVFAGPIHVWATDLAARDPSRWFVRQADIDPVDCGFSFTALPNHLYTLTTTLAQGKGATTPPAPAPLGLPYADDFESYTVGAMPNIPKYFATVQGAFEVAECLGGRSGQCLEQEITVVPIKWGSVGAPPPVTVVGDPTWTDYRVSIDVLLVESGTADLVGRITAQNQGGGGVLGYHLRVSDSGNWDLFTQDARMQNTSLAAGSLPIALDTWHTLELDFTGPTITALADGNQLAQVTDSTYSHGNAGLEVSPWIRAQFDNFSVTGGAGGGDAGTADAGDGGAGATCTASPPAADANGIALITDFSNADADAGAGAWSVFGSWSADPSVFGGGTYFYPGMGPGTDSLADPAAGLYCTTLGSQNSFMATATPGTGWVLSGRVVTFSGAGFYLYHCVDASKFHGIEFTISGNVGNAELDAGSPNQMTFSVRTPPDLAAGSGAGNTCTLPGCTSPYYSFTVPAEPTTMQVTWEMLRGGAPIYVLDPTAGIWGLEWTLPWPCTSNPTPYDTSVTIRDVAFF